MNPCGYMHVHTVSKIYHFSYQVTEHHCSWKLRETQLFPTRHDKLTERTKLVSVNKAYWEFSKKSCQCSLLKKQLGKKNIATICYRFTISWVVGVQTKAKEEEKKTLREQVCVISFLFFPLNPSHKCHPTEVWHNLKEAKAGWIYC